MKNFILFFLFLVFSLFTSSCEKFLDERPTGVMTSDAKFSSIEVAQAFRNSAYVNSTVFNMGTFGWGGNTILLLEYMTGKAQSENSQSFIKDFLDLTVNSGSAYLEAWWQNCYAGIAKCNLALTKLSEFSNLDQNEISKYIGEVKFNKIIYM